MNLDLSLLSNWTKILEERYVVRYVKGDSSKRNYKYIKIPAIYSIVNSNVLLVGIQSNSAKKHWYLGAKISQYLYVSPSTSPNFVRGVEAQEQKRARLNNLTLVNFKDYGIYPYVLAIEIPYWLEDAYVEVWEYSQVVSNTQQFNFQEIEQKLDRIEYKIDNLSIKPEQIEPSINSSTSFNNPDSSASLGII